MSRATNSQNAGRTRRRRTARHSGSWGGRTHSSEKRGANSRETRGIIPPLSQNGATKIAVITMFLSPKHVRGAEPATEIWPLSEFGWGDGDGGGGGGGSRRGCRKRGKVAEGGGGRERERE